MSRSIDTRIVEMDFDNSKFEDGVKQTIKAMSELDDSLKFKEGTKGFANIEAAANNVKLEGISSSLDSINRKFSVMGIVAFNVISNLTNSVMSTVGGIARTIKDTIITSGRQRALNIEQAKFQFRGLGMDVDATMASASAAVDGTSYSLDAAAKVAAQLGASGMRAGTEMTNALTGISGVAAMTGSSYEDIGNVFTKVAGQGRLMGDDLLRLSSRGINAAATLAKVLGKSEAEVREMVTKGQIDFQTFADAMYESFGEHATKANETFTGAFANMKSALGRIGEKFFTPFHENARDVFNAIRPVINDINNALTPMFDVLEAGMIKAKTVIVAFMESLQGEPIAKVTKAIAQLSKAFTRVFKIGEDTEESISSGPLKLMETLAKIGGGLKNIFGSIVGIFGAIGSALKAAFPTSFVDHIHGFATAFHKLSEKVKLSDGQLTGIREVFTKVFSVMNKGIGIVEAIFKAGFGIASPIIEGLSKVLGYLGVIFTSLFSTIASRLPVFQQITTPIRKFGSAIEDVISNIVAGLPSVEEFAKAFEKFKARAKDVGRTVKDALAKPLEILKTVLGGVAGAAVAFATVVKDNIHRPIEFIKEALSGALDALKSFKSSLSFDFEGPSASFGSGAEGFGKAIAKIKEFLSEIDLGKALAGGGALLAGGGLFSIGTGIKGFFDSLTSIADTGLGIVEQVRGALDDFRGILESYQQNIKANVLIKIAAAIGILVVALLLLSTLDAAELMTGVAAMGVLMAELTLMMSVLNDMRPTKLMTTAVTMIVLGVALGVLAGAVKKLGELEWGELARGTLALAALSAILVLLNDGMSGINSAPSIGGAVAMIAIAAALKIMAGVLRDLGSMEFATLAQGLVAMTAVLAVLTVVLDKMTSAIGGAASMVIVAAALLVLYVALEKFGSMPMETLAQGMIVISLSLAILVAAVDGMSGGLVGAAAMLVVALALIALSAAVFIMGSMPMDTMIQGLLGLAVALAAFVAIGLLLAPVAPQVLLVSAALLVFSAALLVAAAAIVVAGVGLTIISQGLDMLVASGLPAIGMLLALTVALLPLGVISPLLLLAGVGLLAFGAGLVVAAAGMVLMSQASAGGIGLLLGLTAATIPIAALSPIMVVAAAAMLALGAAALVLGAGMVVLSSGMTLFGVAGPIGTTALTQFGEAAVKLLPAVPVLAALSAVLTIFGAGAIVAGAGAIVLGAGLLVLAAGLAVISTVGETGSEAMLKVAEATSKMIIHIPGLLGMAGAFTAFGLAALSVSAGTLLAGAGMTALAVGLTLFNAAYPSASQGFIQVSTSAMTLGQVAPILVAASASISAISSAMRTLASGTSSAANNINKLGASLVNLGGRATQSASMFQASTNVISVSVRTATAVMVAEQNRMTSSMTTSSARLISITMSMASAYSVGLNQLVVSTNTTSRGMTSAISDMGSSVRSGITTVGNQFSRLAPSVSSGLSSSIHAATSGGKNLVNGFINGAASLKSRAYSIARSIGAAAVAGINAGAGNRSPSRLTFASGVNVDQGLVNGMLHLKNAVTKVGTSVGRDAAGAIARGLYSDGLMSGSYSPSVRPVMDMNQVNKASGLLKAAVGDRGFVVDSRTASSVAISVDKDPDRTNQHMLGSMEEMNDKLESLYGVVGLVADIRKHQSDNDISTANLPPTIGRVSITVDTPDKMAAFEKLFGSYRNEARMGGVE